MPLFFHLKYQTIHPRCSVFCEIKASFLRARQQRTTHPVPELLTKDEAQHQTATERTHWLLHLRVAVNILTFSTTHNMCTHLFRTIYNNNKEISATPSELQANTQTKLYTSRVALLKVWLGSENPIRQPAFTSLTPHK